MRRLAFSIVLIAILVSADRLPAHATPEGRPPPIASNGSGQIERLLDRIGFDALLEQTQSRAMSQFLDPSVSMDEDVPALARGVLRAAFSPQRVRPIAVAALLRRLESQHVDTSLAFLESSAAPMVISSSSFSLLASSGPSEAFPATSDHAITAAHEREALIERILDLGRIRTVALDRSLAVTVSMWKGANDRLPPWKRLSRDHLHAVLRQQREHAELALTTEVIPALRRVPVHELDACASFLASEAGRSLTVAINEVVIESLSVASREAGAGLVDAFRKRDRQ